MLLASPTAALAALGLGATRLLACVSIVSYVSIGHIYTMGCGMRGRGERGTDGAPGSTHDTAGRTALVKKQLPLACDYAMPYHITGWSNDLIGARLSNQTP
jgi:hypothetical protein